MPGAPARTPQHVTSGSTKMRYKSNETPHALGTTQLVGLFIDLRPEVSLFAYSAATPDQGTYFSAEPEQMPPRKRQKPQTLGTLDKLRDVLRKAEDKQEEELMVHLPDISGLEFGEDTRWDGYMTIFLRIGDFTFKAKTELREHEAWVTFDVEAFTMHLWPYREDDDVYRDGHFDLNDELDFIDLDEELLPCSNAHEVETMARYYFLLAAEDNRIGYFKESNILYSDTFRDELIAMCKKFRNWSSPTREASKSSSGSGDTIESVSNADESAPDDSAGVDEPNLVDISEMAGAEIGRALRIQAPTDPHEKARSPSLESRKLAPSRTVSKHRRAKKTSKQPVTTPGNDIDSGDDDDDTIPSNAPGPQDHTSDTERLREMKHNLNEAIKEKRSLREQVKLHIKTSKAKIGELEEENAEQEAIDVEEARIVRSEDLLKRTEDALEEFVRQRKEVGNLLA